MKIKQRSPRYIQDPVEPAVSASSAPSCIGPHLGHKGTSKGILNPHSLPLPARHKPSSQLALGDCGGSDPSSLKDLHELLLSMGSEPLPSFLLISPGLWRPPIGVNRPEGPSRKPRGEAPLERECRGPVSQMHSADLTWAGDGLAMESVLSVCAY